jgi:hypothetical protein
VTAAFSRANQARRVLEVGYSLLVNQGARCQGLSGQEGLGASGENFDPCTQIQVPSDDRDLCHALGTCP